uniref:TSA: Wollemia nobilis Ref_Wollemi_Transcript_16217_1595 transcribed RNA sequence n=1 Tax=Wollemia nobilis TaxID=56998 RepID=A0A0C9RIH9_9CONI
MAVEGESAMSFYEILGVKKESSDAEIRSAYRKLAMKWHPDKWSKDLSSAEQAKLRFQQIQEAYSVLSDDTKRVMYDAGVYEPDDDVDGFADFLDEMATMMAEVKTENNKEESFEELQEMFTKMVNEDWFTTDDYGDKQSKPTTTTAMGTGVTIDKQCPHLDELTEFWNDGGEDGWFDEGDEFDLNAEDDLFSDLQNFDANEERGTIQSYKKPRVCTNEGSGFEIRSCGTTINSYTSTTFVV